MRALWFFLIVCVGALGSVLACDGASECSTWQDCVGSDEAEALRPCDNGGQGAVIQVNAACAEQRCKVECAATCIPYGCAAGSVCNVPIGPANAPAVSPSNVLHGCAKNPIACGSSEDCPVERPSQDGAWSCEAGFCRFPGFAYAFE